MYPYILPLSAPEASLENTGGKGMSLARLASAGLPVPPGFHVTTLAYQQFVEANHLQPLIMEALRTAGALDPASLEAASVRICELFAGGEVPPEVAGAVSQAYTSLESVPVAVRSSATAEDLPGASFAGQQETYLNIRGEQAVLEAVKKCWASLWTARAIAYRLKTDIPQDRVALAVVVQALVDAQAAGILFTANPTTGKRSELVINAAWGLGEAVVSGAVTPDTLAVNKETGRVVQRQVAEKMVMTARSENGVHEEPVPAQKIRQPVLKAAQTAQLARLGVRIEELYGMPMDIEWAVAGDQVYILQARPITALPPEWRVPEPKAVYARGSLAEHTPNPVTPLFATLGLEIANHATARMWERVIGKGSSDLVAGDGMYLAINGYVYGGIRMGGTNTLKIIKVSISQVAPMFRGSVARWQAARHDFARVVADWEDRPVESMSPSQLLEGVRAVFGAACRYFTDIQTTLPAASSSEVLFTKLYERLVRRAGDPPASVFLMGSDTAALRSEKSLFDLAEWLKTTPELADYILQIPSEQLASEIYAAAPPFPGSAAVWDEWRQRFEQHLEQFGRTAYEFDFANPTPYETPAPLLDAVKAYLNGAAANPYLRQEQAVEKREQAAQAVLARARGPVKSWFLRLLRWAQETAPMREDSIFDMGMGHVRVRQLFAELGQRLADGESIDQADDIYWLEKQELEEAASALEHSRPLPVYSDRIPGRKEQWQGHLKLVPPVMLPERSGWLRFVHGGEAKQADGKLVLKGVGTSAGRITAPACVLNGPEDFGKLKPGDVMVAATTTPAWTPLFAIASAVVTDIGGPLSHSSIVAREYGIPAVMAARSASRLIESGQLVTVDGGAGTVTVEA